MIVSIEGRLIEATPLAAVIDVSGLGYEVHIPVTTAERLPNNGEIVKLHTLAVYREDSASLYGFAQVAERDFFRLLVEKVSGVGPRIALGILSHLSLPVLQSAIANGDAARLAKCPGIGKKTAERLIIELRDKMGALAGTPNATPGFSGASSEAPMPSAQQDAVDALIALGYKAPEADKSIRKAIEKLGADASTEALIRGALS